MKTTKLEFLDGMRGVASLYVAAFHATRFCGHLGFTPTSVLARGLYAILSQGFYSVSVFIVLSGFCLAIPVAKARDHSLKGGWRAYIYRRGRRILPPYYAALLLSLAFIACIPIMRAPAATAWDDKLPLDAAGLISHIFLVHNLFPLWIYRINGPLWSVATEWQIYFFLPFLLIPVWRSWGGATMLLVAVAAGALLSFAGSRSAGIHVAVSHPWFLGLFGMGAWGASLVFADRPRHLHAVMARPAAVYAVSVTCLAAVFVLGYIPAMNKPILTESLVGFAAAVMIVHLSILEQGPTRSRLARLLSSDILLKFGFFSYSLYLIHSPILALGNLLLLKLSLPGDWHLALMLLLVLPTAVLVAYLFHLAVERRFMSEHQTAVQRGAGSGTPSPAIAPRGESP